MLLNIFMEIMMHFISEFFDEYKSWIINNILNVCTVIFDQLNTYLLNKSIILFKNKILTDPKLLNTI